MSIEKAIFTAIKESLEMLDIHRPLMVQKKTMAQYLDISTDQLDRLIRDQVLQEEVHFTRFTQNGHPMFDVAQVFSALRPKRATEKVI